MAYNTLGPFKIDCPVCGTRSEHTCQIRTAAIYDGGDEKGRFFALRAHAFGDRLAWWPKADPRYPLWRKSSSVDYPAQDACDEWCNVQCPDCLSELTIVIRFESLYVVGLAEVRPADQ